MHHFSKLFVVPALAALIATLSLQTSEAFDPLTLTIGATAYVLTGTQVALAVAGIAGLAIAKEKILFSALSRRSSRRGRRSVDDSLNALPEEQLSLGPFFDAIAAADVSDCGKMLVCYVVATPESNRTQQEQLVAKLFENLSEIDPASGYANYQLAAMIGSLGKEELCADRYARCPVYRTGLSEILEAHGDTAIRNNNF